MAEPEFSGKVREALDGFTVPPLPVGFADRLLARIDAGVTKADAPATTFANRPQSRRSGSAWRRSSRIIGSVAFLSLATATAAASGFFGNPVYVPGVSEVLAKTELAPTPQNKAPVVRPTPTEPPAMAKAETEPELVAPVSGTQAVVSRIEQLRMDPKFDNLTPRQKLVVAGKEVRTMVRSGEVTRPEARAAVRELVRNADPKAKEQFRETMAARRRARLEQSETAEAVLPEVDPVTAIITEKDAAPANDELALVANDNIAPERIDALRNVFRDATPAQRAEFRRALRERRAARQRRSQ